MSSNDLDQVLLELVGRLPGTAKRDLIAMAGWMLLADCLLGGPYDGYQVVGEPDLVEQTEYDERLIHVYRRGENGLTYQGYRPCCEDPKCGCLYGKSDCIHNTGEVSRSVQDMETARAEVIADLLALRNEKGGADHDPS